MHEIVKRYVKGDRAFEGANLQGADLRDAGLRGANLGDADLRGANLQDADLQDADLRGANLGDADLQDADLRGANLQGADLRGANLGDADLGGADLWGADLRRANLRRANLRGANLRRADLRDAGLQWVRGLAGLAAARLFVPPETGAFDAWKKCRDDVIVKVQIPATARRSSATGRKCRAERVKVLKVIGGDVGVSGYDPQVQYVAGAVVECDKWCTDRWQECAGGIHFFMTRAEAEVWGP